MEETVEQVQHETAAEEHIIAPAATPVIPSLETVTLRHPHTGDTKTVNATSEELIPLMALGYGQVKGV